MPIKKGKAISNTPAPVPGNGDIGDVSYLSSHKVVRNAVVTGEQTSDEDDIAMIDPSTLCPYCDRSLPATPTPYLLSLLASTRTKSYPDPRPGNQLGLVAPCLVFISVCMRHQFENDLLPMAQRKKWPTVIPFDKVRERVERMKESFLVIILDEESSQEDFERGEAKGPRAQSHFWREFMKEVKNNGSRAAIGASGQYRSFQKLQPGYYGEIGSAIIHHTLYNLFPPSSFKPGSTAPLSPIEFIHQILVPEAAVALIMEDRGLDVMNAEHQITAIKLMKDSAAYGIAMFPDGDINSSAAGSGSGADGNVLRDYSHEMVQERAKMNMELEMEAEAGCPPSSHLPDVPSLPARPSSTSLTVDQLIVKHITDTLTADQSASKDLHNLIRDKDSTTVSSARAIEMYAFGVGIKGRFMKSTVNINGKIQIIRQRHVLEALHFSVGWMNAAEKVTKKVLELEADRKECLDELANSTLKGDRLYKHIMNW